MRQITTRHTPSFAEEERMAIRGYHFIAGIDESGRGALAGPVVAAAVILPFGLKAAWLKQVRDSKLLTTRKREYLYGCIKQAAISTGVGIVSHLSIDTRNIVRATRLAMKQAIEQLRPPADSLLIDFLNLPEVSIPQKGIVNGDRLCFSISCASIIAKVTRDRIMVEMDTIYPGYKMGQHKGYCTEEHIANLNRLGPSPIHRRSFRPVKEMILYEYKKH
ncbi:MAG: ribonuclease HII [Dehalococcoidia bacterium]|nr:MAG: ribonuclease HII [Dehalococcoidia bacterium]